MFDDKNWKLDIDFPFTLIRHICLEQSALPAK